MKLKIKYPYGESHFGTIIKEGYYFVDKTRYIEYLEEADESYVTFFATATFWEKFIYLHAGTLLRGAI